MQTPLQQPHTAPLRLHLGCGPDHRPGWVNVDVNPSHSPDLVAPAHALPMLQDGSCEAIESCHLFEHLTLTQAKAALREWRRLLQPGGELHLELPNLERCVALIGTDLDGHDLGLISLFGYPPEVDEQGEPQLHKWGWTPSTLERELRAAGFADVRQVPITQTHRPAARFDRDMRLVATAPASTSPGQRTSEPESSRSILAHPAPSAVQVPTAPNAFQPSLTHPARPNAAAPYGSPTPAHEPTPPIHAPRSSSSPGTTADEPADPRAVLGWPRYDDSADLDHFFHVFARVLSGRDDVALFLRVDPDLDPPREEVILALEHSHARVLGEATPLDIRLLEGPLSEADWREVGTVLSCRIRSGSEAAPRDAARQMATPVASDAAALFSLLTDGNSCAPVEPHGEAADAENLRGGVVPAPGVTPDPELVARIDALHPWFYPVEIGGLTVVPGLGSVCAPDWLTNRTACRATILVEEVLKRVDFRGRSVLDLACNCAFWSSHYARAGARRVLGIEGRARHVEQARLYWDYGGFLPAGEYAFREGDIANEADWAPIRAEGGFDVTLCAGILYHIPNYADVLRWAAEVTNEVLIVDTRVQDGVEETITEPGDLTFNAIASTRDKIVPHRERLLATLRELGFEPEVMPVGFGPQLGVDDVDSYAGGARVTIVAHKVKAPLPAGRSVQLGTPR